MDTGTGEQIRRLERLCRRHRAARRWATLRDKLPSELADKSSPHRREVLERALTCDQCRARNDLGWNAVTTEGASTPVRNPTTTNLDVIVPWHAWPETGGFGDRRAAPGPRIHIGWVIVGASTLAVTVGLAALGMKARMDEPAGGSPPPAQVVEEPADASGASGKQADYADLRAGDCVRDMDTDDLYFEVVSCDEPHTDEVVGTLTLARGKWPGQARVDQLAERGCAPRFEKYIGTPASESSLELLSDAPVKIGWPEDRFVVCTVVEGFGKHTGSLRDAGR